MRETAADSSGVGPSSASRWPSSASPSSPTGASSDTGAMAIRRTSATSASVHSSASASSTAGRRGAEGHGEPALDGLQLAHAVADVHGQAHGAALLGHRAADGLANPQRGVGGEAEAAAVVELLHRAHEPDRALLDQVQQRHPGVLALEALGEMDDEPQVGLDHPVLGFEVAALDAAGELELLGRGQEARAGDALEKDSEAVAELASVRGRRRSGGHAAAASITLLKGFCGEPTRRLNNDGPARGGAVKDGWRSPSSERGRSAYFSDVQARSPTRCWTARRRR